MSRKATTVQTAQHHMRELRGRLLYCVIFFGIGGGIGYAFHTAIITLIQRPLGHELFYSSPMGSFNFVMKICMLIGLLIALPAIIYNLLRFIEPAFNTTFSRRRILTLITASTALMLAGVAFAFYVSLPIALNFFNHFSTQDLHAMIMADQYYNFVLGYMAMFAIVFQLPLVLLFIDNVTPMGPTPLRKYRKFVVIGAFLVGILIPSTPDPLSQTILASPILILYEVSILLVAFQARRRLKSAIHQAPEPEITPPLIVAAPTPSIPRPRPPRPAQPSSGILDLRDTVSRSQAQATIPPSNIIDLRSHNT